MGIYRGEVLTIMGALADLRVSLSTSDGFWRRTMKRKKKRTPEEREADFARAEEQARKLRELVAKGEAELEAKRSAEGSAQ